MTYGAALITGASSGIGAAFAHALPRATHLLLTGRNRESLAALAAELTGPGREIRIVIADLATAEGRQAVIGATQAFPVDLVINNAGLGRLGRAVDNTAERGSEMVLVNVLAPVEIARALLPGMLARAERNNRRCGAIFVASAAAFMPIPYFATYAASKTFLLHYTEALAEELSREPVDILALCPGATATQFFTRAGIDRPTFSSIHSAERVAREGLQMLGQKRVHVVGPANYMTTLVSRFLPRGLVTFAAERVMREWK
ncbi:SDR family NAD(P)-dependent oxidoreductase [Dongia soli]|uniref:SDR family NAD(P)-dependent oxidoreductase n=1 Tax=Dongia soli TaxID=600628 RepID=A0ABU5E742_9PROT|nr:SDR family NAD(P)-dependent oxidoreductase [Dongia soli]MDY0882118.1 SDR family NAD(P)-dependent oxidoreductase [Dongia soli]